jgi:molybdopterin molybdotransferase
MSSQPPIHRQASCADSGKGDLLGVEEAEQRIFSLLQPLAETELVDVRQALGRTLSQDVLSTVNVPPHTNSAMDGYAIGGDDIPAEDYATLTIIGTAFAGKPYTERVSGGQCVRIMTGAQMPRGCDTVVIQEMAEVSGDTIRFDTRHRRGQNVRQAGEDLAVGDTALAAGKRLTPADIGLLASIGIGEVRVVRRLRVAFFSTGDELRTVGSPLAEGEIYDSNRYTLYGMLKRQDVDIIDMGVVPDDRSAMSAAFKQAADVADVILTSGGVSVGDADYVKDIVSEEGKVDFWKLAIKPGRPLAFGTLGKAVFFGLPGNPVAVMVTFYQFVQPALRYLRGEATLHPVRFKFTCATAIRKRPGRTEYQRGLLQTDTNGDLLVSVAGAQGSGILSSMSAANCFIVLAENCDGVAAGEEVLVEPFDGMV